MPPLIARAIAHVSDEGILGWLVLDHKIEDGINAAHMMFKCIWFDEARCAPGLEALRQYRVDYDEKARAFKTTPKEDL